LMMSLYPSSSYITLFALRMPWIIVECVMSCPISFMYLSMYEILIPLLSHSRYNICLASTYSCCLVLANICSLLSPNLSWTLSAYVLNSSTFIFLWFCSYRHCISKGLKDVSKMWVCPTLNL